MGDLILLLLLVLNSTALWPLNRWALRRGARTECLGMALCAVLATGAAVTAWAVGRPLIAGPAVLLGSVAGVAYAVGFVLMLLIGHFLLKERLSALGWIASLLGVTGIVLLSAHEA